MDGAANWRPTQGAVAAAGGVDPNAAAPAGSDWRAQLQPEARHRILNKIKETLMKHLPVSVPEGLTELYKIAARFEERIYTAATSQHDYLRKISLKMLSLESQRKTQQNPGNAQVITNQNPPGPGSHRNTQRRSPSVSGWVISGSSSGSGVKKQRVDVLDDRCEVMGSDVIQADRISALPDELQLHILTHLPLKDAIRTGALARGWRDRWKGRWAHRASLEVHLRSREDLQRELDMLEREPHPRRRLERFSLTVEITKLKSSELRQFLDYATECGVEDLHVETRKRKSKSRVASKLNFHLALSSPALACLSLRSITVSMFYKGARRPFHALQVIRLVWVSFRPEAFTKMMALCPSLLTLDLRRCRCNYKGWVFDRLPPNLRSLTIADCGRIISLGLVPTLRSFCYSGCPSILPLSIPRVAALSDLYIDIHFSDLSSMEEWNVDKLRKSLPKDLSSLNVLTICYKALTGVSVLSADGASAKLPNFDLHSLKELHLLMYDNTKSVNLPSLYLFLKTFQCPNLERLFVQLPAYRSKPMEDSIDQVLEEPTEDCLDNLVMVKVMNFNWSPSEVQLVSFLLRKARSLRKLLIVSGNVTPVDSARAPEADLLLLREALFNGKIMFTGSDNAATQPYHEAFIKL